MHTLYVLRCISILSAESQILYYVRLMYFYFSIVYLILTCRTFVIRTFTFILVYLYSVPMIIYSFSLPRYISPLCTIFMFSCYLFSLYILSLSIILYLLDLSLTETVKRAYGQWMVYGEFNTLGFVSSPRLAYKF